MREMKDSSYEWIGEIPISWDLSQVRRLFKNVKRIVGNDEDKYDRLALTLNGVIKRSKEDSEGLQPEKFEGYQILKENELVFKMIDLENVNTSRVGLSPYHGLVSPAYIILTNDESDNRFAYYWFMFMYYHEIFNHLGGDGVRSALNAKDMLSLPIPNISSEEKRRIADYLDKKCAMINDIVSNQERIIEKLKEYKTSIITEAVTKGLNPNAKMVETGVDWIGNIPETWRTIRIKWLLEERKERSESGEEEPLSMSQKYGIIPTKEMDRVPNLASSYVGAKIVYSDDLVFNKLKAHLGVFNVSKYDGLVSPDYAVYYSTGKVNLKYLEYVFKTPQCIMEFRKKSSGVADGLTRLYTDGLFSIYCPFPPREEQDKIANYLDKKISIIEKTICDREKTIEKFNMYKKSLIYEVVTGKKEV